MTPWQLVTLSRQHQIAHSSNGQTASEPVSNEGTAAWAMALNMKIAQQGGRPR
jgi:hypothetical protein